MLETGSARRRKISQREIMVGRSCSGVSAVNNKIACAGATMRIGGEIVQGPATNGSLGLSPGRMIHRYQRRIPVSAAIHGSDMNKIMVHAAASLLVLALGSVHASGINSINGGMPNRISMNVTVPKQTQGATFGEKVNSGLQASGRSAAQGASLSIVIECGHWQVQSVPVARH